MKQAKKKRKKCLCKSKKQKQMTASVQESGAASSCRISASCCSELLAIDARLRRNWSPSSVQLLALLPRRMASTMTCLMYSRNCFGSGLSRCPPLSLMTKKRFSMHESWLSRLVRRNWTLNSSRSSYHNGGRALIEIFQPRCDGVAQLVERQTRDLKTECSNTVRSTRKICESFSESKMLC